jgi:hypothetical protein
MASGKDGRIYHAYPVLEGTVMSKRTNVAVKARSPGFSAMAAAMLPIALLAIFVLTPGKARAQAGEAYSVQEIVDAGHGFFGATSGGVASVIENIFSKYGLPNGYVLGQEGAGAFVGGLTYGEGTLYTKNAGDHNVFWQGPSVGWDFGADGNRTMMLVYNLDSVDNMHGRYGGVAGSAYLVAGVGFNVLKRNNVLLVPVRTGVGARLGVSVGYLKLTPMPTWNPF